MYKPEGYKDAIEGLKGSKNTLYIATIGVYNKKLDEGDIRNYLNEIFIGVAVVAAIIVVIATGGVGAAAGASTAWIVETVWDAGDMLKAIFSGDKIGIFAGVVSLLFSGDDIIKGVKYMDEAGDAGKNIGKSLDGDILTDGSHLNLSKRGKGIDPKPDVTYKSGEFDDHIYKTDDIGRIKEVNVDDLKLSEAERAMHNANTPGKEEGDHAGHLIADRLGGSPELDNLVSQLDSLNLSAYKKMENDWANVLKNGGTVTDIKIKINYDVDGLRPTSFDVKYEENDIIKNMKFSNIRK